MSEYLFSEINFSEPKTILAGTWLWIWNADKIPPHIGISKDENYFSLTYKDCEIEIPVSKKLSQARRAKNSLVLVKLADQIDLADFTQTFSQYTSAVKNKITCLKPVLEVLTIDNEIKQLSELLKYLESDGRLSQVFALNLTYDYKGIPAYSVTDIIKRIEHLHETNGKEHKTKAG